LKEPTAIVAISAVKTLGERVIAGTLFDDAFFKSLDVVGHVATRNQSSDRRK
jgi:hypothetical protein